MSESLPVLPKIVAHRGNAAEFPENTLPALRSALELGITHVEFDVQLTSDHIPVVLHDANLQRTAGLDRNALDMTWRELRGIKVNEAARLGDRYHDVGVPTLERTVELLAAFPEATAFVEIKRASLRAFGHEQVVTGIAEVLRPVAAQCVMISFDLAAVHLARQVAGLPIGWVLPEVSSLSSLKSEAVAPEYLFCDQELLRSSEGRLAKGPWRWVVYEVPTAKLALELAARGVEFVETMAVRSLQREFRELTQGTSD
ncbi:MAG: glycerophosphodiester phosphodiesterase family protein [Steroidobacteraceae bacterium]